MLVFAVEDASFCDFYMLEMVGEDIPNRIFVIKKRGKIWSESSF